MRLTPKEKEVLKHLHNQPVLPSRRERRQQTSHWVGAIRRALYSLERKGLAKPFSHYEELKLRQKDWSYGKDRPSLGLLRERKIWHNGTWVSQAEAEKNPAQFEWTLTPEGLEAYNEDSGE